MSSSDHFEDMALLSLLWSSVHNNVSFPDIRFVRTVNYFEAREMKGLCGRRLFAQEMGGITQAVTVQREEGCPEGRSARWVLSSRPNLSR